MFFASDNTAGVLPQVLDAVGEAMAGFAPSYGTDDLTDQVTEAFCDLFGREVHVLPMATGTAANALSIASVTPPWGVVFCHRIAHVMADECGASEFYTDGAKLIGIGGDGAKMGGDAVETMLKAYLPHEPHSGRPTTLSLTQATECGQIYTVDEVRRIAGLAHDRGMAVHMDGARFANAVAALGCAPADVTWKAGVDILSFGATKNGCLAAEAIVVFDKANLDDMKFRRMRAGHLLSKSRFLAAQLLAYVKDGLWLETAGHANAMAARLSSGIVDGGHGRLAWPTEINEVFAIIPKASAERLSAAGALFHEWAFPTMDPVEKTEDEVLVRMVASFATTDTHVDDVLRVLGSNN